MFTSVPMGAVRVTGCIDVEHLGGELQVEQRVDQQRDAVAHDQPGVAPPPAAVGLEVGVAGVAEFVEALVVRDMTPYSWHDVQ